ncbi:hypothetical protein BU24DRAFT_492003 [Aaosphaeria arxii CBS 175.79]|uniref:Fucose-specific lectin n=1 Tax=Aaosphaeria arxii CBS 175.79 TaxID=1450172 RepID=A0A6A5XSC9_9PLEO|nr:uncharacterized protein BU24DRAFT_492003 [Aaosphaeria arxii CBS 175.79]KAF2015806.1 hypothetical protein BU24DRAFT_492003 [Aaosphaeria arxii CBS 175.79]
MASNERVDTTYKIDAPAEETPPRTPPVVSPSNNAPEKLFMHSQEPASSKEVLHDAPEVVEDWLSSSQRPNSPFSVDETVVSGFQSFHHDKDNRSESRRESEVPPEKPKTCGMPRRYFMALIILIWVVLLAIGLGVGLGVGLKKKHASNKPPAFVEPYCADNPKLCIGGALSSDYYTTNGTFNGTGIALATEFWNHQERKIMTVYFQHWTGDIRLIQLTAEGEWVGGTKTETIVTDAKNSTPISTVSYAVNGTAQWHIFYLDDKGRVRQKTNTNNTNIWQDGPLNELNLTAYSAPNVGLQACWYGSYYGDSDSSKFPTRDGNNNTIPFNSDTQGMHLWYPTDDKTFHMYGWYEGQEQWAEQHVFENMNAHAGVGCYSWGPGTTTYAMMVNNENTAEIWWKDTNSTGVSTDEHPINTWVNATGYAINNVYPSTSLGFTEYFYTQMDDGDIMGHDIDFKSEKTKLVDKGLFTVGGARGPIPGLNGTHMSVTAVADFSGGTSLYVFYQTRGDDISVFTRDIKGGQWTQGELPIPDD